MVILGLQECYVGCAVNLLLSLFLIRNSCCFPVILCPLALVLVPFCPHLPLPFHPKLTNFLSNICHTHTVPSVPRFCIPPHYCTTMHPSAPVHTDPYPYVTLHATFPMSHHIDKFQNRTCQIHTRTFSPLLVLISPHTQTHTSVPTFIRTHIPQLYCILSNVKKQ